MGSLGISVGREQNMLGEERKSKIISGANKIRKFVPILTCEGGYTIIIEEL